jgi:hypothetical protein
VKFSQANEKPGVKSVGSFESKTEQQILCFAQDDWHKAPDHWQKPLDDWHRAQDDCEIPSATHLASAITVIIGFTPLDAGNALASATNRPRTPNT